MMLRESIERDGAEADLRAITNDAAAAGSRIPGAEALVAFANAALGDDEGAITEARDRVRDALGSAALVDSAGVIGNFERMVRIADGTGIPLDAFVNVGTESIREELGIDRFAAAERTRAVTAVQRISGRVLQPLLRRAMRRMARSRPD